MTEQVSHTAYVRLTGVSYRDWHYEEDRKKAEDVDQLEVIIRHHNDKHAEEIRGLIMLYDLGVLDISEVRQRAGETKWLSR